MNIPPFKARCRQLFHHWSASVIIPSFFSLTRFPLLNALQNGVLLKIIRHVIKSDHNISQKYSETKRTKWKMLQIMKTDKKRKKQLSCWRTNKSLEIEGIISLLLIEVEVSLVHCLKLVYSVRVLCSKSFPLLCLCVCRIFVWCSYTIYSYRFLSNIDVGL